MDADPGDYVLEEQVGFILRRANQRHRTIFTTMVERRIAPTQFAALAQLYRDGPISQNRLGRLAAMDAATVKGVVERLVTRSLVSTRPDPADARRVLVELTPDGAIFVEELIPVARAITEATLEDLDSSEREMLIALLSKLAG